MNTGEDIMQLVWGAQSCEPRKPDAAALLIDAAAFLAVESGLSLETLIARLHDAAETFEKARPAALAIHKARARPN